MNRIIAALAIAIGVAGYFWYSSTTGGGQTQQQQAQAERLLGAANAQTAEEDIDTSSVVEMQLGNPDAPVTVMVTFLGASPFASRRTPSFTRRTTPASTRAASVISDLASSLPASIALDRMPRLTQACCFLLRDVKPRFGRRI